MTKTVCGVDIRLFCKQPKPDELAAIVAEWNSQQQADFFIALGEALRNCCGGNHFMQWQAIADSIQTTEEEICDGSASQLFREIQCRLEPEVPNAVV